MATQVSNPSIQANPAAAIARRLGFAVGLLLAAMAAAGFGLGIITPPRSGAWCTANCTAYPYIDAGRFFPRDYWWMLPGITLAPLFMTLAACMHFCIPLVRRLWTLLAICCATAATTLIALDYFVQVLVVQPSLTHHEHDGIAILTQYNPHGLFLVLEDLGYLLLAKTMLLAAIALPAGGKHASGLRWTLGIAGGLALASFPVFAVLFGADMALPFELAVITIVWIGLVPSGILAALWIRYVEKVSIGRRALQPCSDSQPSPGA
ncbi:hypothetical protein [Occallatibacter riparius]|uniref:Uncharacterized protein n=1 Tax=Occallatibacter riparius TaxID=1002689 RepID=A0A9J7BTW2_9BACT|nr:hypothetical protein [Occallatibacter riparius]UWZ86331.1 hypothetical protein MOP44_10380 [Occallatibacter riparius]